MGLIAAAGFELLIGAAIGFILFLVGLFFQQIMVFDSIALGVIAGFAVNGVWHLSTAPSIGIGAGVFALLLFLQMTKVGFWIIGVLLSILWGFIFAFVAWSITDKSPFWTYGVWVMGALLMMLLHLWSRKNMNQI